MNTIKPTTATIEICEIIPGFGPQTYMVSIEDGNGGLAVWSGASHGKAVIEALAISAEYGGAPIVDHTEPF